MLSRKGEKLHSESESSSQRRSRDMIAGSKRRKKKGEEIRDEDSDGDVSMDE